MWLFGQLNTLGVSEVQKRTDENAVQVLEMLRTLNAMRSERVGGRDGEDQANSNGASEEDGDALFGEA